jgi:hypothetical protein
MLEIRGDVRRGIKSSVFTARQYLLPHELPDIVDGRVEQGCDIAVVNGRKPLRFSFRPSGQWEALLPRLCIIQWLHDGAGRS